MSAYLEIYAVKLDFLSNILGCENETLLQQAYNFMAGKYGEDLELGKQLRVYKSVEGVETDLKNRKAACRDYLYELIVDGNLNNYSRSEITINVDVWLSLLALADDFPQYMETQETAKAVMMRGTLFEIIRSYRGVNPKPIKRDYYCNIYYELQANVELTQLEQMVWDYLLDGRNIDGDLRKQELLSEYTFLTNDELRFLVKSLRKIKKHAHLQHFDDIKQDFEKVSRAGLDLFCITS